MIGANEAAGPDLPTLADVVVIGAGPAGLAAAGTAAAEGATVLLLDEQPRPGGQIYRNVTTATARQQIILGADYSAGERLLAVLREPGLRYVPNAAVWQLTDKRDVSFSIAGQASMCQAQEVIIATGALERSMPFAGWTLPGVMTAGAAQIMLKSGFVPTAPIVLAGSGPLMLLLAIQLHRAGVAIAAYVDTTPKHNWLQAAAHFPASMAAIDYLLKGRNILREFAATGIAHYRHACGLRALGQMSDSVKALEFEYQGRSERIECDWLFLHTGVVPNVQLSRSIRAEHEWQPSSACWVPRLDSTGLTSVAGISIAGDGAGIGGAEAAAFAGELAALGALRRLGLGVSAQLRERTTASRTSLRRHHAARPFIETLFMPAEEFLVPANDVVVCRCEEVTAGTLREHVARGCLGPNQTKAFSRCGMGPCQGRYCGLTVAHVIAAERGVDVEQVGYYRLRPPVKPVTLGEVASLDASEEIASSAQVL